MALTLAACGGEDDTPFSAADVSAAEATAAAAATAAAEAAAATAAAAVETAHAAELAAATAAKEAAETAQAAAEAAQAAAEADAATAAAAQAAAETAQAAAEAAQATAEAAQATAEAARDAAVADAAAAATAQAAAEAAQATAEASLADQNADITAAGFADIDALLAAYTALVTPVSSALTTSADVVNGTAANDTVTGTFGTTGTLGADIIIDSSTSDSDTLTLTGEAFASTADTSNATIRNIENVNIVFDTLVNATVDASGVQTASTITISNVRAGSGADVDVNLVTDGSTVNVTDFIDADVSADADGDLTVSMVGTGTQSGTTSGDGVLTMTASTAGTVDADSATGAMTVTAANATVIDADSTSGAITITNGAASTITADTTTADISIDASASTSVTANTTTVGTVTVTAEGDDIDVAAVTSNITVVGSNDTANALEIDGVGTADSATINIGADVSVANGGANTVETITVNSSAASTVTVTNAGATTYNGDANTTFAGTSAMFDGATVAGAAGVDLTDVTAAVDADSIAGTITVSDDDIAAGRTITLGSNGQSVVISGELDEDLTLAVTDGTSTDVSYGVNITLSEDLDNSAGAEVTLTGASGADAITTATINVGVAQTDLLLDAADTAVTMTGSVAAVLDVSGTAIDVASLDASAYTGAITATVGAITATTGAGNDIIEAGSTSADLSINTGAGNDTVSAEVAVAGSINAGAGTDTLDATLAAAGGSTDLSGATLSGFELVDVDDDTISVASGFVSGQSLVIDGSGTLDVRSITATTDLSSLSFASTADTSVDAANQLVATLGLGSALTVTGSSAVDTITTNAGNDTVTGGAGADVINVKAGDNYVDGGAGNDNIDSTTGDDTIFGGAGDDDIDTTGGDNVIDGGAGADTIDTGAGDDTITGGEGADTITSGAGADTIVLTETTSADDDVVFVQGDGSAVDTGTGTFSGFNVITGFTSTSDDVDVSGVLVDEGDSQVKAQDDASTAALDLADSEYTDQAAVIDFLNDTWTSAGTGDGTVDVSVVAITFSNFTAVYAIDDADDDQVVDTGELELLATADTVLVAADII